MALNLTSITQPLNRQVVDQTTGVIRDEWARYFQQLTSQLNEAVGQLGTDKAPADAEYIVGASNGVLTAERVVTDTPTVSWDLATAAQATANVVASSIGTTQLAGGGVTIAKVDGSVNGNRYGIVLVVGTDGVMEVGRYIDFHNSDGDTSDFAVRLETNGGTVGLYETPSGGSLKRIVSAINSTLAQGDILYFDGTNFVRLAPGTSGQHLRTNGAAAPTWEYPGLTLLATGSVSNAATMPVLLTGFGGFRALKILLSGVLPATDGTNLLMRSSSNGGSSYDSGAGNYNWVLLEQFSGGGSNQGNSTGDTQISLTENGIGNASSEGITGWVEVIGHASASLFTKFRHNMSFLTTAAATLPVDGGGTRLTAADVDAVEFRMASGNITGSYAVYGYS
jgi:hypothetical protein